MQNLYFPCNKNHKKGQRSTYGVKQKGTAYYGCRYIQEGSVMILYLLVLIFAIIYYKNVN